MRTKRWTVAVVLGCGLLLPTLAINGTSALRRSPVVAPTSPTAPGADALAAVDAELGRNHISGALTAWHSAYAAALHEPRWEGLVAVADARLRIERRAGFEQRGTDQARPLYLMALFRARRLGSVEGLVQVAAALEALGDRQIAAEARRIAARLDEERRQAANAGSAPVL